MRRLGHLSFLLLALGIAGCSSKKDGDDQATSSAAAPASTPAATTSAPSRLCSLFTVAEIKDILGAPVGDGKAAGPMDSACQWDGSNPGADGVFAQVQVINDPQYWEKHTGAKGYEVLHDLGKEAFVATSLGGWEAGAVTDKQVIFVSLSGGAANRDRAVDFLRRTLQRLGTK